MMVAFIGCTGGQQGAATSSDSNASADGSKGPADEQSAAPAEDVKAEVSKSGFQVWKDSLGTVWGHGAIEIKNTGSVAVDIGDISISFVGKDNSVAGTLSMVLPVPEILQPGEVAYAGDSSTLEGVTDPSEITGIEANIDFDKTDKTAQILEISDLKIASSQYGGPKVTGRVNNSSNENADDIRIIIAMFDENNNLLGVYTESPQVTLAPGKSMGFEASYPPIEIEGFANKVKNMVGKAFNWKFDF
jgi:hypothetical protein